MVDNFGAIGIILIFAILFPIVMLAIPKMVAPRKPGKEKETTYECGMETRGETWIQFKTNYFLYALVFVAFDVETIFLYPWAVQFRKLGTFAFVEMFIFIAILLVGFWYAWKEGALEWK
ncbi:MAG: NADH-quinone oxidoreductase subunit A [Peptococcaceae bacterium]|nr:NADH-quinone oxidoreductase subunit A [Peptococcaceae bacterium]